MRRSLAAAALAAVTLLAGGTSASASESPSPSSSSSPSSSGNSSTQLERVSAYTQPSVVYIGIEWTGYVYDSFNKLYLKNNKPFTLNFQCTGYVVNPDGYIATAGHCVDPAEVIPTFKEAAAQWAIDNGYYQSTDLTVDDILGFGDFVVENADGKKKPDSKVTAAWSVSAGGVDTGKALPARVVKWRPFDQGDGALLKVEADNLNAIPLSDTDLEIGTEIVSIGYPGSVDLVADQSFTPSYKDGAVSSKKTVSNGLLTVYEISAAVSGGMSGGPTVNLDSEVVGFNSFGINSDIETQQFNFVRPVETVKELLGDAGTQGELSQDAQDYRAGLDAYFAGDKETAVTKLQSVVDNQPTHELAKQYLEKAKDLPDPVKEDSGDSGSNMGLIIGIIVGLLVLAAIVGALILLLGRNKKKQDSGATAAPAYGGMPPGGPGYPQQPGMGTAPGATSTAVLTPPSSQPGPSAPSAPMTPPPPAQPTSQPNPPAAPSTPPPAPAPTPAAETASEVDEDIFCQNCGTKAADAHQKFCKHCGAPL